MPTLSPLNNKRVKELSLRLVDQYGASFSTDLLWYLHDKEQDIYLLSAKAKEIDFEHLRINNMGLYVANILSDGSLRLSIEGAQLLGPHATRQIVDLNEQQTLAWMRGDDVDVHSDLSGFVIVRGCGDYLGCGRIKNSSLKNFLPKSRRATM